jgi:hypothetical protein
LQANISDIAQIVNAPLAALASFGAVFKQSFYFSFVFSHHLKHALRVMLFVHDAPP